MPLHHSFVGILGVVQRLWRLAAWLPSSTFFVGICALGLNSSGILERAILEALFMIWSPQSLHEGEIVLETGYKLGFIDDNVGALLFFVKRNQFCLITEGGKFAINGQSFIFLQRLDAFVGCS